MKKAWIPKKVQPAQVAAVQSNATTPIQMPIAANSGAEAGWKLVTKKNRGSHMPTTSTGNQFHVLDEEEITGEQLENQF